MVPPINIVGRNLSSWDKPPEGKIAIDPVNGRLAFPENRDPGLDQVLVSYAYGFSADVGGGPYERFDSLLDPASQPWSVIVAKGTAVGTIQAALSRWQAAGSPSGVIQIEDNGVYGGNIDIAVPSGVSLVIQAANGLRPDVRQVGNMTIRSSGPGDAALTMNGLLIERAIQLSGDLTLVLKHCTLVPGMRLRENGLPEFPDRDSIVYINPAADNPLVIIDHSIVGSIRLPEEARGLVVTDSIIDACRADGVIQVALAGDDEAATPGPVTTLERATIFGSVYARQLDLASEVIFTSTVTTTRRQEGCVRFSYLPDGSQTPRRFQCQPDLALVRYAQELGQASTTDLTPEERDLVFNRLKPRFTSEHYGDPGYAQLSYRCAEEIRAGAEDGSEMGAFEHLKQPHREANLRAALGEYLPFGLEAGLIYVT